MNSLPKLLMIAGGVILAVIIVSTIMEKKSQKQAKELPCPFS